MSQEPTSEPLEPEQAEPQTPARRSLRALLAAWILLSAAGIVTYLCLPRVHYEAKVWLVVRNRSLPVYGLQPSSAEGQGRFLQTQIRLVTSPDVLSDTLASHPELARLPMLLNAQDPETRIRNAIVVETPPGTNLMTVSVASRAVFEGKAIADAVVESYLKAANTWATEEAQEQVKRLSEEKRRLVKEIEVRRIGLENHFRSLEAAQYDLSQMSSERFSRLLQELDAVRLRRLRLESQLEAARVGAGKLTQPIPWRDGLERLVAFLVANPDFAQLAEDLERSRKQSRMANETVNPGADRERATAEKHIVELTGKLEHLWTSIGKQLLEDAMTAVRAQAGESRIAAIESDLIAARTEEQSLTGLVKHSHVQDGPTIQSLELESSRAALARAEKLLETIQDQITQIEFDARGPQRIDRANRMTSVSPQAAPTTLVMAAIPFVSLAILVPIFTLGKFYARRADSASSEAA